MLALKFRRASEPVERDRPTLIRQQRPKGMKRQWLLQQGSDNSTRSSRRAHEWEEGVQRWVQFDNCFQEKEHRLWAIQLLVWIGHRRFEFLPPEHDAAKDCQPSIELASAGRMPIKQCWQNGFRLEHWFGGDFEGWQRWGLSLDYLVWQRQREGRHKTRGERYLQHLRRVRRWALLLDPHRESRDYFKEGSRQGRRNRSGRLRIGPDGCRLKGLNADFGVVCGSCGGIGQTDKRLGQTVHPHSDEFRMKQLMWTELSHAVENPLLDKRGVARTGRKPDQAVMVWRPRTGTKTQPGLQERMVHAGYLRAWAGLGQAGLFAESDSEYNSVASDG